MRGIYFESFFGDIAFTITAISTERGADVVVHSPASGDKHALSRRGRRHVRCTCEILFASKPGEAHYLDRYDAFVKACENGKTDVFSHPIDGAYRAKAAELQVSADGDELALRATAVFLRDEADEAVFESGAGVAVGAGVEAVTSSATSTNAQLAAIGLPPDVDVAREDGLQYQVLADSRDAVDAWDAARADGTLDSAAVALELASLAQRIDEQIIELELRANLARWVAYENMILLRYELARAAEAFTADDDALIELVIEQPRPLLSICAELYGALEAVDQADRAAKSNRIRTPGLVPRGTRLRLPRPRSA